MKRPTICALVLSFLIGTCPTLTDGSAFVVSAQTALQYVCPMHADVRSRKPGKCPRCGMSLRKVTSSDGSAPPDRAVKSDLDGLSFQIPDAPVYNQDGKALRLYTDLVKGKTVAINFIFTTCTTVCPPLTATFRKVQQEMGDRMGKDVVLISISVDPITDVPERLKSFSAKFHAGPGWSFITGNKQDIDGLLRSLGAFVSDKNDHTPMVLVGNDPAHYWTRSYGLAKPLTIVDIINEAARKPGVPGKRAIEAPPREL